MDNEDSLLKKLRDKLNHTNQGDQMTDFQFPSAKEAVLAYVQQRLNSENPRFTSDSLRNYVMNNVTGGVSPGSSDRVLRMLRQQGKLDYTVENRGKSLYRARPLGTTTPAPKVSSETKWIAEIFCGGEWIGSGNPGMWRVKFDTIEAALSAIDLHGSKGAEYRIVEI